MGCRVISGMLCGDCVDPINLVTRDILMTEEKRLEAAKSELRRNRCSENKFVTHFYSKPISVDSQQ